MDRKKVINGLREMSCRATWKDIDRIRHKFQPIINDAIELLKEQDKCRSFIVIDTKTGKEADEYEIALHEDWAKHLCYCDMEGWAIESDGSLLLIDECGQYAFADTERFKVKWE